MGRLLTDSYFGSSKFLCIFGAVLLDYTMSISEDEIFVSGTGSLKSHYIAQLHIYLLVIRGVLRLYSCGRHGCVRARMRPPCVVGIKREFLSIVHRSDYSVYTVVKMKYGGS